MLVGAVWVIVFSTFIWIAMAYACARKAIRGSMRIIWAITCLWLWVWMNHPDDAVHLCSDAWSLSQRETSPEFRAHHIWQKRLFVTQSIARSECDICQVIAAQFSVWPNATSKPTNTRKKDFGRRLIEGDVSIFFECIDRRNLPVTGQRLIDVRCFGFRLNRYENAEWPKTEPIRVSVDPIRLLSTRNSTQLALPLTGAEQLFVCVRRAVLHAVCTNSRTILAHIKCWNSIFMFDLWNFRNFRLLSTVFSTNSHTTMVEPASKMNCLSITIPFMVIVKDILQGLWT